MCFEVYKKELIREILSSERALIRLKELKKIAQEKQLFLVCFEKDYSKCHRSIIKELMLREDI
jgi:uncharacterized protein YeaO (DUF488 family)